ncbi:MAG: hypothetical protein K9L70_02540 [Thiohalocapsa sp.]|nr:hypothetical protein [Thiohalocapsa sp.]MCF7990072.1 hypothetical protein [Thiohalocapsa sp.]
MQEEFDALWHSPFAVELADAVVQDIKRLAARTVIPNLNDWRQQPDPAAPIIEAPVYRKEVGLWEHQKHFVKLAFDAHLAPTARGSCWPIRSVSARLSSLRWQPS